MPLVELCDGELREKLLNPLGNLEEEELPADAPETRVHADADEWALRARELVTCGLAEAVADPVNIRGKPLVYGAFGVVKPGNNLEDGRLVLRFIMDFRGVNSSTIVLTRDVRSFTGAPALQLTPSWLELDDDMWAENLVEVLAVRTKGR